MLGLLKSVSYSQPSFHFSFRRNAAEALLSPLPEMVSTCMHADEKKRSFGINGKGDRAG